MNALLERIHQAIMAMLCMPDIDLANTVKESDVADFLTNAAWTIYSTFHTVHTTSPGAAVFGWDMLFDILFLADWYKWGIQAIKNR